METKLSVVISLLLLAACVPVKETVLTEIPYVQERFLILTADDFGASLNINEGIKIAADNNAITTISVLTNFTESLDELKAISENHPEIGIGVHLNITTGKPVSDLQQVRSLVNADGTFYKLEEILPRIKSISIDELRTELRAQILALVKYHIPPDHLSDQNGILSFYEPFFDVVIELAKEFNLPLRTPEIASVKFPELFTNSAMRKRGVQLIRNLALASPGNAVCLIKETRCSEMEEKVKKMDELGILHPDLLIECFWGNPSSANFLFILDHLPNGTSEIILHLGTSKRQDFYPSGLDQNAFSDREEELVTITSYYLKGYYNYMNIRKIGYSGIVKGKFNQTINN